MNKTKTWVMIIGAGLAAGLAAAIGAFPEYKNILAAVVGLVTAITNAINGANNEL